ncbi:hypothetical protein NGTWS0302_23990 [Mycolicibacterium cyprinidarum]|uniref:DUF4326 domain-containing protein n=1 Tax=Mycolicibacterium cyprinidarum TaxID=2860311 RepID=A0ABQ4V6R1_9MYCO|nr:hypothetical protein NGTWS0302_23990 [Mycolicibacterium sp. NGTWS0302]GJF10073.1 hypothetical protein NGTWS1702_34600 [Mycolicibacterium sp. NGTWSNA01]
MTFDRSDEMLEMFAKDERRDTAILNGYHPDDPGPPEPPPETDVDNIHNRFTEHRAGAGESSESTTWEPVDLGPYLRGEIEHPTPTLGLTRSDGLRLLYPGREHAVLGETESGKTWLALGCVAAELDAGHPVLYIHYEEGDPGSTLERLRLLGLTDTTITDLFRFVAPAKAVMAEWMTPLLDPAPTLVVHDGVNEAMSLLGVDIMAADGASAFRRRLIAPCTKVGAATLSCDHLPKTTDGRSRDAYGSVHKGNALDGARIVLENDAPFGRGLRGVSHVFVTKDRPGYLRAQGRTTKLPGKTFVGTLIVDAEATSPDFELGFYAPKIKDGPDDGSGQPTFTSTEIGDMVYAAIAALPDQAVTSQRQLFAVARKAGLSFRDGVLRNALDDLLVTGRLTEAPGRRGATGYKALVDPTKSADEADLTASQASSSPPRPATASGDCVPIETGRGTQSHSECVPESGRSGTQWDAVEETSRPQRYKRTRKKGERNPQGAVFVDRTSKLWGNPFKVGRDANTNADAVRQYRDHLDANPELVEQIKAELRGRDLVCACDLDEVCHADVLLDIANGGGES